MRSNLSQVSTILLCGVDLFFRAKLEALLPEYRFITVDHTGAPELVIADISRIDPQEVADTYPDVPILGYTNHTDTAGPPPPPPPRVRQGGGQAAAGARGPGPRRGA